MLGVHNRIERDCDKAAEDGGPHRSGSSEAYEMKKVLQITAIVGAGLLCGCGVTAWAAWELHGWTLSKEVWVQPCRDVVVNIRMIKDPEAGRVADVIGRLEKEIDSGLVGLSIYPGNGNDDTRKMVEDSLHVAREYRKRNPRFIRNPTIRAAVDSVLKE